MNNNTPKGFDDLEKLVNALCIIHHGWRTETEGERYKEANEIVWKHGHKLHLQSELKKLEEK